MKCLLLAAGLGTRLRPITDHIPKCLVKVNGVTLLDRWLMSLHKAGVAEFLINTHYLADQVRGFLEGHPLRDSIKVVHEETLRGTGGTLLANSTFFKGGATLVAHADNLCLCDWPAFFEAHMGRPADAIVTMMTFVTDSPSECGIVETDRAGRPCRFHEKSANPPGNIANAAVYIFEPEVVSIAQQMKPLLTDISTQLLPAVLSQTHLWRNEGVLIDIGTSERLGKADRAAASFETEQ